MSEKFDPMVIEAGKVKRKTVKALKRGEGKLVAELEHAVQELRDRLGAEANGKELVPIVFIYKQKQKRRRGMFGM